MTVQECYERMGGDYEDVCGRLEKDERILRLLGFFVRDESYAAIQQAFLDGNAEAAFQAAHSLKGVCLNMGITHLGKSAAALSDVLRDGAITPDAKKYFETVKADYRITLESIQEVLKENS